MFVTDPVLKKITIEPRDDFYNSIASAVDITDRIDISKTIETAYNSQTQNKDIVFSYAKDGADVFVKEFEKEKSTTLGQYKHSLPNNFKKGTETIQLKVLAASYPIKDVDSIALTSALDAPFTTRYWNEYSITTPLDIIEDNKPRLLNYNYSQQPKGGGLPDNRFRFYDEATDRRIIPFVLPHNIGEIGRFYSTLNGTDQYYTIPTVTLTGDFDISCDVSTTDTGNQIVLGGVDDTDKFGFLSNVITIIINGTVFQKAGGEQDGKLNSIRVTRISGAILFYINGVSLGTVGGNETGDFTIDYIGKQLTGFFFDGIISDVKITDAGALIRSYAIDEDLSTTSTIIDTGSDVSNGTAVNITESERLVSSVEALVGYNLYFNTVNGQDGRFVSSWAKTIKEISTGINSSCFILFDQLTWSQFSFRDVVYIDEPIDIKGYWIVEKLNNYQPENSSLVKCKLLRRVEYNSTSEVVLNDNQPVSNGTNAPSVQNQTNLVVDIEDVLGEESTLDVLGDNNGITENITI